MKSKILKKKILVIIIVVILTTVFVIWKALQFTKVQRFPQYVPTIVSDTSQYLLYRDNNTGIQFLYSNKYRLQTSSDGSLGFQYKNNNLENSLVNIMFIEVPVDASLPEYAIERYTNWLGGSWSGNKLDAGNRYKRNILNHVVFNFTTPHKFTGFEIYLNTNTENLTKNGIEGRQLWGPLFVVVLPNKKPNTGTLFYAHGFLVSTGDAIGILKMALNTLEKTQ